MKTIFSKEEVGKDSYPKIIEFIIDRICEYVKQEWLI